MNYEQKYKEALEKAKSKIKNDKDHVLYESDVIDIFPELYESEDERIKNEIIDYISTADDKELIPYESWIAWLEKQGQSKRTSIWKHWKDGIAGNGDGIPSYLIKNGLTYSLSSYLSFECDYIELSELDSPMLEKQSEQSSNILWHDVNEEPEPQREIFCEWKSSTGVWHSVVFYYADSKAFFDGEGMVQNVLKWTYVNEMLEKQGKETSWKIDYE